MTFDPLQIGLNALSNSSRRPVSRSELLAILATGEGPGHLVRAVFEDCSYETLESMAMSAGRSRSQILTAYRTARRRHGARNTDIESVAPELPD